MADGSDREVTQADQNDINSQWSLFFTDLDELLSEYEQHRSTNDIAITENLTIRLENAVRALQNVSHFVSQTNKETVLEMARNFQLMLWDCHRRCKFPSRTRCSQVAVFSLNSPNRVDTRQVGRPKFDIIRYNGDSIFAARPFSQLCFFCLSYEDSYSLIINIKCC